MSAAASDWPRVDHSRAAGSVTRSNGASGSHSTSVRTERRCVAIVASASTPQPGVRATCRCDEVARSSLSVGFRALGGALRCGWLHAEPRDEREVAVVCRCLEWPQAISGCLLSAATFNPAVPDCGCFLRGSSSDSPEASPRDHWPTWRSGDRSPHERNRQYADGCRVSSDRQRARIGASSYDRSIARSRVSRRRRSRSQRRPERNAQTLHCKHPLKY